MTAKAFVNGLLLSSDEGREPMTITEAIVNIREYELMEMDVPGDLTPELLCKYWNEGLQKEVQPV